MQSVLPSLSKTLGTFFRRRQDDLLSLVANDAECIRDFFDVKWSQKTGQSAKVYPKPLKGYENGEAPEVYRPV